MIWPVQGASVGMIALHLVGWCGWCLQALGSDVGASMTGNVGKGDCPQADANII